MVPSDLHQATRTLRQRPALLATAVVSLAVGIAAKAAVFSLLDGLGPPAAADRTVRSAHPHLHHSRASCRDDVEHDHFGGLLAPREGDPSHTVPATPINAGSVACDIRIVEK